MSLKGTAVSNLNKRSKSGEVTAKQETSYNRFFVNAFSEAEIDEIVNDGGGESEDNFKTISESKMKQKDYWEKMFAKDFTGRDKRVRKSRFQALGGAIYSNYFKGLRPVPRVVTWKTKTGKEQSRFQVPSGKTFNFQGKQYRAGSFLPKSIAGN